MTAKIRAERLVAKVWPLLGDAVEAGIAYGWTRAHKYADTPEPEAIRDAVYQAVMHELAERFDVDPPTP